MLRNNPKNSPVWNDMIKIKDCYLARRQIKIGNGLDTDLTQTFGETHGVGL